MMPKKVCTVCKISKNLDDFYNNRLRVDGKHGQCKTCMNAACKPKTKEQASRDAKKYAENNKEKVKERWKSYYLKNKEVLAEKRKIADKRPDRREKIKAYRNTVKDRINEARKKRRDNPSPKFLLEKSLRDRFYKVIVRCKRGKKHTSCLNLIGCDFDTFKNHIESQFEEGMNWLNHGNGDGKWNIDHIKPLCLFDLFDLLQQKEAFHYSNLRPLWFKQNIERERKKWKQCA
jgi:hypothetical protein